MVAIASDGGKPPPCRPEPMGMKGLLDANFRGFFIILPIQDLLHRLFGNAPTSIKMASAVGSLVE